MCPGTGGLIAAAEKPTEDSEGKGGDEDGAIGRDGVGIEHGGADDGKGDEQDGTAPPFAAQKRRVEVPRELAAVSSRAA